MLSQDHSGAVLRTDCREAKGKSRGPTRKLLQSPRSDRGCEKEGGVKGDSTYFGLSNWNDGIA